jgi:CheY-like chemotaxis protein
LLQLCYLRLFPMRSLPSPDAKKQNILMVDDNKSGLAARRSVLLELGFEVTTATSPAIAWDRHPELDFDMVITDHRLPKTDGLAFIEAIRATHASMRIILLSGHVEALGLTEKNTGADVVIQKNTNEVPHLTRSVTRLLRRTMKKPPAVQAKARAKAASASS